MLGRIRKGDSEEATINLLLLELLDRDKAIFRRIGFANAYGKGAKIKILSRSQDEDKLPCNEYRDGLHSIRII